MQIFDLKAQARKRNSPSRSFDILGNVISLFQRTTHSTSIFNHSQQSRVGSSGIIFLRIKLVLSKIKGSIVAVLSYGLGVTGTNKCQSKQSEQQQ
jgi:hypothetical protein